MVDKDRLCRHLPERILRQYNYCQTIPKTHAMIGGLNLADVVVAFQDFTVHVLTHAERGHQTLEEKPWRYAKGYIKWFYCVSHPMFNEPAPVVEYTTLVPHYEEVIVEQQ